MSIYSNNNAFESRRLRHRERNLLPPERHRAPPSPPTADDDGEGRAHLVARDSGGKDFATRRRCHRKVRILEAAAKGGAREPGGGVGGERGEENYGQSQRCATLFVTSEGVDAALRAERPPDQSPGLPHCYASYLRVTIIIQEAIRSEHSDIYEAVARDLLGFLGARTFEPCSSQ